MSNFTFVLVGRPNVGKSTLFNALAKKNLAIVADIAGVTVDYKEVDLTVPVTCTTGEVPRVIDKKVHLIDTGGILSEKRIGVLADAIKKQALLAVKKAHLVGFVVDGREGLTLEDQKIAQMLRKNGKRVLLLINKTDTKASQVNTVEWATLGFDSLEISAAHRSGISELYSLLADHYQQHELTNEDAHTLEQEDEGSPFLSIAVVGKANVGKSTLINALLKEPRLAVSEQAGTTRDAISTYVQYNNQLVRILDTAGLKRKNKATGTLEKLSTSDTIRSIIFAQVVALVIDATVGLTKQDLTLAQYIQEEGRAPLLIINKIDLVKDPKKLIASINEQLEYEFSSIKKFSIIGVSALKKKGLGQFFKAILSLYQKWATNIKTSLLNRWLALVITAQPPALYKGRYVKIKFITQSKTRPPTFNLWVNIQEGVTSQYLAYLRNRLCRDFNLWGVPIRFNLKTSANPFANSTKKSPARKPENKKLHSKRTRKTVNRNNKKKHK